MKAGGIQGWIEHSAEKPAFFLAFGSMVLRAAAFWSGGSFSIAALLGPRAWLFNDVTGLGIGVGCELLGSIAGRQWQRYKAEAIEAGGRRGVTKAEREALVRHFQSRARLHMVYCALGLAASVVAGFAFFQSTSGNHSLGGDIGELAIAGVLVAIVSYLGIFKETQTDDPRELATAHARTIGSDIVSKAGARLAAGTYSRQDALLVAGALPKVERERFLAATLQSQEDDPIWTVNDLLSWMGAETLAARRQVQRKLSKLMASGAPITRDMDGKYLIPRSEAALRFAGDFQRIALGEARSPSASARGGVLALTPYKGSVGAPTASSARYALPFSPDELGTSRVTSEPRQDTLPV